MKNILLGNVLGSKEPFRIPLSSFDTHWHLIGGTGKGKTTAIHTMIHGILLDPIRQPCVVIIDRMGGLSSDLLRWMASEFCTDDIRARLAYVEPAREDVVLGFNPLIYGSESHAFYKVSLAAETVLRGWTSQNLSEMPRLSRWLFNSFFACALLGLTVSDTVHLLLPGSPHHDAVLQILPPRLQGEWSELIHSGNRSEIGRILESTRNKLKPYYESPALRRMFGTTKNNLDMHRFMREGRILLINLAPLNAIPDQVADAIGGLVIHEVLTTARSLTPTQRRPTYLFLDEFQRFVGPDIESAIPEVRQLGIKLILSHQSLSQLEKGDLDLTTMIFQAQSRMIFGVQGDDADVLAHELASIQYNPKKIKDEIHSRHQRIAGYTKELLASWGNNSSSGSNWMKQYGQGWGAAESITHNLFRDVKSDSSSRTHNTATGDGGSLTSGSSYGEHEQLVPIHEDYLELASRTYSTFDEDKHVWGREIRNAARGRAFIRLVDQVKLHDVDIKRSAPGHLGIDAQMLEEDFPELLEDVEKLKEQNFRDSMFQRPEDVDREIDERMKRVLYPLITVPGKKTEKTEDAQFL